MGNTVVLKPATYTRLSALLFAEICAEAGLPPGQLAGRVCVRVASAANEHICTCMCDVVAVCCRCVQRGDWPGVVWPDDSHPPSHALTTAHSSGVLLRWPGGGGTL